MNTRNSRTRRVALVAAIFAACEVDAMAQQVECSGPTKHVAAVTRPAGHVITTRYQSDSPNLQPLLSTTIQAGEGCLVASLSGQVRITDNYVVFQVRVNGVPLQGQVPLPLFTTPVVFVAIDASTVNDDEQLIDPTKPVAFNFFTRLPRGTHVVEVLGAAGSGVDPENPPTATHLVLTLAYQ